MKTKSLEIPPMTHPYGASWEQPPRDSIILDDTHALMTEAVFKKLPEYSCTNPTGVYEGKMWKRHNGLFDPHCKPENRHWVLCWFGFSDDPDKCSNNSRRILIA